MDKFCSERGTLLDNGGVKTLKNPELHSLHCLVDVNICYSSGYEVLAPAANGTGYCRAFDLGSNGTATMLSFARARGQGGGSCSTCSNEDPSAPTRGFRATVLGTIATAATSGAAAMLENVQALAHGAACPAGYAETAAPVSDNSLCLPTAPAPPPICSPGTFSATTNNAASCKACPSGKYQDHTGQTACVACTAGKYQDLAGQTACVACAAGKSQFLLGQTVCAACAAGEYQDTRWSPACRASTSRPRARPPRRARARP
jgi:hypothetical protein